MAHRFISAQPQLKYKTFTFYDYVVKYPVEPFLPENRDEDVMEKWKIYISHKAKIFFTLDAPDTVQGIQAVNMDGKGKKELVIYGSASGSGCFWTWYVFHIRKGNLIKVFEIRDVCVTKLNEFLKRHKSKVNKHIRNAKTP